MATVYVEARPKGRVEGSPINDYLVESRSARASFGAVIRSHFQPASYNPIDPRGDLQLQADFSFRQCRRSCKHEPREGQRLRHARPAVAQMRIQISHSNCRKEEIPDVRKQIGQ